MRFSRYAAVGLILMAVALSTTGAGGVTSSGGLPYRPPADCSHVHDVWSLQRWQRSSPKPSVVQTYRSCDNWTAAKDRFYRHRKVMLWNSKYRSFEYPDGSHWAVPYPIAWCESGGDYHIGPSGAYGEIPPLPQYQPPKVQDETAYRLFQESGEGPWAPYESECRYR